MRLGITKNKCTRFVIWISSSCGHVYALVSLCYYRVRFLPDHCVKTLCTVSTSYKPIQNEIKNNSLRYNREITEYTLRWQEIEKQFQLHSSAAAPFFFLSECDADWFYWPSLHQTLLLVWRASSLLRGFHLPITLFFGSSELFMHLLIVCESSYRFLIPAFFSGVQLFELRWQLSRPTFLYRRKVLSVYRINFLLSKQVHNNSQL